MKPENQIETKDLEIDMAVELTFPSGITHATLKEIQSYPSSGMPNDYIFEQHVGWDEFRPHSVYKKEPSTERWFPLPGFILNQTKIIPLIGDQPMSLAAGQLFQFMKSCAVLEKYYEAGDDKAAADLMPKLGQRLIGLGSPKTCADELYRILKIQLDKIPSE